MQVVRYILLNSFTQTDAKTCYIFYRIHLAMYMVLVNTDMKDKMKCVVSVDQIFQFSENESNLMKLVENTSRAIPEHKRSDIS